MSRHLTGPEEVFIRSIFGNSLPSFSRIYISDGLGIGGAPYTTRGFWDYTIHLGPEGYKGILWSKRLSCTLAHEMTHVWQGHHEWFPWGYMASSLLHQAEAIIVHGDRNYAYKYDASHLKAWDDYNVEQQAFIVEDWVWYKLQDPGTANADERFRFIKQIRAGKN